ncbi:MAG: cobalamin B12-binding domain-containing protein [Phycisphaerales bacterium]
MTDALIERLFEALINGDRPGTRCVVDDTLDAGHSPEAILTDLFWPTYEMIDGLFRKDQLSVVSYNFATRLLRAQCDQMAARLPRSPSLGRTVFAVCGHTEADELAAQIAVDLIESSGFSVVFAGSGVARDEILAQVHERKPSALLLFASAACDLPEIRALIDDIQEIGACRGTQVVVGGGVFNRAEGLAEEIGADLWAEDPAELVQSMLKKPGQRATPEQRTVGRKRLVRSGSGGSGSESASQAA